MKLTIVALMTVAAAAGIAEAQFDNGNGNFFSFSSGPSAQAAPAFRPQFQSQPSFQSQFQQSGFQSQPSFRPQSQPSFRPQPQQQPQPQQSAFRQSAPAASGSSGCTPSVNYQSGNRNFWVSWRGEQVLAFNTLLF